MAAEIETEAQGPTTEDQKLYELGLFEIRRDFLHRENEFRYSHKRHAVERESNLSHYYQSSLRETSDSLLREPSHLRSQIAQLKEELSIERINNQYLRFQLVDAGKEISELEIDVRRARAGLPLTVELSSTSEEAEKSLAQLKRKVDRLRASMLEMDASMQKMTKDREEMRDKNNELAKLLDNAVQDKTKAENQAKDVERRSARRIEELETKLKQKIDENIDKERELEGLRGLPEQMEAQSDELKAVQRGADHARAELAEYRAKYDALTDKLQADLRQERSKSLDLETKIRSLTSQLEREKAKVADEQKLRKEATDKLQKTKADSEKLHKKCDDLQLEVAHLEKTIRIYERNK